ncbi:MAG TPA: Lpg1974 family pore-forming outer membrane protein [Rhabdochlamydiaceae bacterium]|nr:Lpg1974 family pore-forming outer membrane protein [Rhabdochlamydiaceae bacterium]
MILDPKRAWTTIGASMLALTASLTVLADNPNAGMKGMSPDDNAMPENVAGLNATGLKRMAGTRHFYATGEFLYWRAYEDGMDYAQKTFLANPGGTGQVVANSQVHNLHFHYGPGVRAGIGYYMPHSDWDLFAQWTYLHPIARKKVTGFSETSTYPTTGADFLFPTRFAGDLTNAMLQSAEGHWGVVFHTATLELGRVFSFNRWLSLRPHFGLMSAWINQKIKLNYDPVDPDLERLIVKQRNNFWGVGFRAGLDTRWPLSQGFSIYGNFAAALLWGHFHLSDHQSGDPSTVFSSGQELFVSSIFSSIERLRPNLQATLGLRWDKYIKNNRYHWGVNVGYEFNEWFDQNELYRIARNSSALQNLTHPGGDLGFQGWNFGLRFDF